MLQALERNGRIDKEGQLHLDVPLTVTNKAVKVIVLIADEEELTDDDWQQAIIGNEAFNFLNDPAEDIYSLSDGEDFSHEA
jgi:hypothetical protein